MPLIVYYLRIVMISVCQRCNQCVSLGYLIEGIFYEIDRRGECSFTRNARSSISIGQIFRYSYLLMRRAFELHIVGWARVLIWGLPTSSTAWS